jgi:PAS domain S-box-containing protein
VVAADHFLRGLFWPRSVYGVFAASEWRWLEHAGWVIFEDVFLIQACIRAVSEMRGMAERQAQLEATRELIEEKVSQRTAQLESLNKAFEATAAEARQSEEKYRHTLNAAADAIIGLDESGIIIEFSRAAERTLGYTRAELIGAPISAIVPVRLRTEHETGLEGFLATGPNPLSNWQGTELPGLTKDGREIPLEVSFSLLEAGGRKYITAVLRDITQRKQAEEESRRIYEENQRLLASIPSVLISFDGEGRVTKWNRAAQDIFGFTHSAVIGEWIEDLPIAWDGKHLTRCIRDCVSGQRSVSLNEFAFSRPDGEPGFLSISITPVSGQEGNLQGILLLGTDISERRNLETQLAHAQKLESIGQLAAGIAHEINTPIQYVGDNVAFLKDAFADFQRVMDRQDQLLTEAKQGAVNPCTILGVEEAVTRADLQYLTGEIPRAIDQTLEGVGRVAKIVRAMKEFSHPGGEGKIASDMNKLIENTITVAHNEWKYVADLVTDLDSSLPLVPCFAGEFNQVILNLIVNAAHAIGDHLNGDPAQKGLITISTRAVNGGVEVRVKDTGTGIPEAARSKIFYPFFTTKPVGKGTGQGLAIAHAVVVKRHSGTLTFDTEIGKGTTFFIWLPIPVQTTFNGIHTHAEHSLVGTAGAI